MEVGESKVVSEAVVERWRDNCWDGDNRVIVNFREEKF